MHEKIPHPSIPNHDTLGLPGEPGVLIVQEKFQARKFSKIEDAKFFKGSTNCPMATILIFLAQESTGSLWPALKEMVRGAFPFLSFYIFV